MDIFEQLGYRTQTSDFDKYEVIPSPKERRYNLTECILCNLINNGLLDQKNTEYILRQSFENTESGISMSYSNIVDYLNNNILSNLFKQEYPEQTMVFDVDIFRKYVLVNGFKINEKLTYEIYSKGAAIEQQYGINVFHWSNYLITTYFVKKHLENCMQIKHETNNDKNKYLVNLKDGLDFALKVSNKALQRAAKRNAVPSYISAELIFRCEKCHKKITQDDLFETRHDCQGELNQNNNSENSD